MSMRFDGSGFEVMVGMHQIDLSFMQPRPFGIGGHSIEEVACKLCTSRIGFRRT